MITHSLGNIFDISVEPYTPRPWRAVANEPELRAVLTQTQRVGETIAAHYQRIEQELGALLDALSLADARELHRRLVSPLGDDALAKQFGRLVNERRQRLITFLAGAPRRAALRR